MEKGEQSISMYAVGDVCVDRQEPESIFALSAQTIKEADIAFCQLEVMYSERGTASIVVPRPLRAHPRNVSALAYAGFDVVSLAGNHAMDFGAEALADTVEALRRNDIRAVGVGMNISEARKPVIFEENGVQVAFLAYSSILPHLHWAEANKPGCAPIRAHTLYEQAEIIEPGSPPRILTFAQKADLEAMKQDVANAKKMAHAVIVSIHWGLHFTPVAIATYQTEVAHAAIDAGADLILGSHAHILKAIEVYKGKVITYCLGNFAFDNGWTLEEAESAHTKERLKKRYPNWQYDKEYPTYTFPIDSRKTMLLKSNISKRGVERVSFLPAFVNPLGQPELLRRNDPRSSEVFNYVNTISEDFRPTLSFEDDEVLIHADRP